ncbi:MAG: glycoside hydrolase family 172 protein [Bacteroidota bacterium]
MRHFMPKGQITKKIYFITLLIIGANAVAFAQIDRVDELYNVNTTLESRSISFENTTGAPGEGGKAASELGATRKGAPNKFIRTNETVVLCDIENSGTIRHIWMTGEFINFPWIKDEAPGREMILRNLIVRAYWDGQEHPSIECPLGDFMGFAHSKITSYHSAVHSVGENGALNFWLPMPFTEGAKITLTNESDFNFTLFYQIDYTINDQHKEDVGRLHVLFRRENPTTQKEDFVLMPKRTGTGRFMGAVIGVRTLYPGWWGEGEVKFYMDGDTDYPTICGTGSEDYVGLSYGIQNTTFQYLGCNLNFKSDSTIKVRDCKDNKRKEMNREYISMYRWHIPDPIYWKKECSVTIQQIGCCYYERDDDWSTATFWYEPLPSEPLPEIPSKEQRVTDLDELFR